MDPIVDWPARMREMAEFVGLTAAELDLVRNSAPLILKHAENLTAAVYDNFLKFPEAARFFLTGQGQVDEERLERRRHTLMRWLRAPSTPSRSATSSRPAVS